MYTWCILIRHTRSNKEGDELLAILRIVFLRFSIPFKVLRQLGGFFLIL
jgi:hypothetical protein